MASSCILHQNEDSTIIVMDIPRSIELAQGSLDPKQRLISSKPLEIPYPLVEPKTAKARAKLAEPSLDDLLLQRHLQLALDYLNGTYQGLWCFPRVTNQEEGLDIGGPKSKRKRRPSQSQNDAAAQPETERKALNTEPNLPSPDIGLGPPILYQNLPCETTWANISSDQQLTRIPPCSTALLGDIQSTRDIFLQHAPKFNIIILDPPWPNRSARRSKHYSISYGASEIRGLLSAIPVREKLANEGLVVMWITNKSLFREIVLGEGGLFEEWNVELVEEWVWLKVTENGEPICALDSVWRKPYEILLVGRHRSSAAFENGRLVGEEEEAPERVKRRVILGVPDLHSRKPNLKGLVQKLMSLGKEKDGKYEALEIFARNLTTGWWSWGDEACKFQAEDHWTSSI